MILGHVAVGTANRQLGGTGQFPIFPFLGNGKSLAIKIQCLGDLTQFPMDLPQIQIGVAQHFKIFDRFGQINRFLVSSNRLGKITQVAIDFAQINKDAASQLGIGDLFGGIDRFVVVIDRAFVKLLVAIDACRIRENAPAQLKIIQCTAGRTTFGEGAQVTFSQIERMLIFVARAFVCSFNAQHFAHPTVG